MKGKANPDNQHPNDWSYTVISFWETFGTLIQDKGWAEKKSLLEKENPPH
jgi:hypothetical protein